MARRSLGEAAFDAANVIFMLCFSATIIYPFWDAFLFSFSGPREISGVGFRLWITHWSTDTYRYIFDRGLILIAYRNTLFRTVAAVYLTTITCLFAAYPLSKRRLPGRTAITAFFVFSMFFSGGLIPTYLLIRGLGFINNLWVLVIPQMFNVFYMIIMRNYLMAAHLEELEEAALVDGAGYPYILFRIMVPLSKPLLATVALWVAVAHWNEWFYARIYLSGNRFLVLQSLLQRLIEHYRQDEQVLNDYVLQTEAEINSANVVAATMILTIGPIVLLYPFLQKYFVKGVMIGSLKG